MINDDGIVRNFFAFGGSAGGYEALVELLRRLPETFPGTIGIVLHRSPVHASKMAAIIQRHANLAVSEPADGDPIKANQIYLAPQDFHMIVEGDYWRLNRGPKRHLMRPAVDPFLISAAASRGNRVVGVLLSGGGADGVDGLIAIENAGGIAIAQKPEEARVKSMPATAIRDDDVNAVLSVDEIAAVLPLLAEGRPAPGGRRNGRPRPGRAVLSGIGGSPAAANIALYFDAYNFLLSARGLSDVARTAVHTARRGSTKAAWTIRCSDEVAAELWTCFDEYERIAALTPWDKWKTGVCRRAKERINKARQEMQESATDLAGLQVDDKF